MFFVKEGTRNCSTKEDLQKFNSLSMSFTSNDTTKALVEFGCLVPNCQQSDWSVTSEREVNNPMVTSKDQMTIDYYMPAGRWV
jgi:hypothetical protein